MIQIHEQVWGYSQVCRQANCCRGRTVSIATIAARALRGWDLDRVYQRLVGGPKGTEPVVGRADGKPSERLMIAETLSAKQKSGKRESETKKREQPTILAEANGALDRERAGTCDLGLRVYDDAIFDNIEI